MGELVIRDGVSCRGGMRTPGRLVVPCKKVPRAAPSPPPFSCAAKIGSGFGPLVRIAARAAAAAPAAEIAALTDLERFRGLPRLCMILEKIVV